MEERVFPGGAGDAQARTVSDEVREFPARLSSWNIFIDNVAGRTLAAPLMPASPR